jgi:hypothetical protein
VLRLDTGFRALAKEPLKPLVPEGLDHCVLYRYTIQVSSGYRAASNRSWSFPRLIVARRSARASCRQIPCSMSA